MDTNTSPGYGFGFSLDSVLSFVEHETPSVSPYQAAFGSRSADLSICLAGTQIAFDASLDTFHDPTLVWVYVCSAFPR